MLPAWGYKVGSQWDSLVYVDGFAGLGKQSLQAMRIHRLVLRYPR